jgi:hypothetical protein
MSVRKILQTVIWSKRALRRILIGFGVLIGVLFVGYRVFYETEMRWLTSGERQTGRAVLAQIDSIQDLETISREDFEARERGLSDRLDAARDAARTMRDRVVYSTLYSYLEDTEQERADVWELNYLKAGGRSVSESDRGLSWEKVADEKKGLRYWRAILHRQSD